MWTRETGRSFVAFVQQIDKSVPQDKTSYIAHRSYRAALYLRRIEDAPQTVAGQTARKSRSAEDMLAVVIKSMLPLIRAGVDAKRAEMYEAQMWTTIASIARWHQRDIIRLQKRVRRVHPIALRPDVPRLVYQTRRSASGSVAAAGIS